MKFSMSIILFFGLFLFGDAAQFHSISVVMAQPEVPPYAKWGEIAVQKTKEKYPQANIIDYQHIGRETGDSYSTEKFKLWLKKDNQEFGVFVDIKFENETEEVVDIQFRETTR